MAGDWIKVECATPDKPEVYRMADSLGIAPEHVVGCLIALWVWADQQTTDGNAPGINAVLVDRKAGVPGFAEAMKAVGWLVEDEGGLSFPAFDRHNGKSAKSRASTAKRVAQHKAKKRNGNDRGNGEVTEQVTGGKRGCIPRPLRKQIYERDGHSCLYCGRREGEYSLGETKDDARLAIDHVIPLSMGGADLLENMVTACCSCNSFKSDRTPDECGLPWPKSESGQKIGVSKTVTASVSKALPREEKRREEGKNPPSPPSAAPRGRQRGERLPEDWDLPNAWREWAQANTRGIDPDREAAKFRDFWVAKAGAGAAKKDWLATWRNWCRTAEERAGSKGTQDREKWDVAI